MQSNDSFKPTTGQNEERGALFLHSVKQSCQLNDELYYRAKNRLGLIREEENVQSHEAFQSDVQHELL